jgi:glucose-1-phosphate thymidylyltransferase
MDRRNTDVVAIIPAAGKATRLAPFPCPKELFPVGYQDFLVKGSIEKRPKVVSQYLIENLRGAGVRRMMIIVGEGKQDLLHYYGDGSRFDMDITYLFQEKLNGMPTAINLANPWLHDETVLFGMPDTIIEPDNIFQRLLEFHLQQDADLSLGLFPTNTPQKFGMVETDADGNVIYTIDKPKQTDLRFMWGCACWSSSFTREIDTFLSDHAETPGEIVLGDVFNSAMNKGMRVKAIQFADGEYMDIGTSHELDIALAKYSLSASHTAATKDAA